MKEIINDIFDKLEKNEIGINDSRKQILELLGDNTRIRQVVIGQSGYGIDGCKLCGSEWMRRPNIEKEKHDKNCIAYPK